MGAHGLGQAFAGDQTEPRAHFLQNHGRRDGEQQGPEQGKAEMGPGAAGGGDGARPDEGGGDQEARAEAGATGGADGVHGCGPLLRLNGDSSSLRLGCDP